MTNRAIILKTDENLSKDNEKNIEVLKRYVQTSYYDDIKLDIDNLIQLGQLAELQKFINNLDLKIIDASNPISISNLLDNPAYSLNEIPLTQAVIVGDLEIIKYLISLGASVEAVNKNNETSVHKAIKTQNFIVTEYLLKHYSMTIIDITDNDGFNILKLALSMNNKEFQKNEVTDNWNILVNKILSSIKQTESNQDEQDHQNKQDYQNNCCCDDSREELGANEVIDSFSCLIL